VTAELPASVRAAIAAMLDGVSRTELARRAGRLSERYRGGAGSATVIADRSDALAYLVTRMPATYAAVAAAFAEARLAVPEYSPGSVLDVGAGPGTASIAAVAAWPEIAKVTMIDSNRHLIATAGELVAAAGHAGLASSQRILGDAVRLGRAPPQADLVVAAYTLGEIGDADTFVKALWAACNGALVLVEPGTPDGFSRIRQARSELIAASAAIAAPCPHALPCPIVTPDWCHFAQRLARSRDHRLVKSADAPFEDEKFSYVIAARPSVRIAAYEGRVLAPPRTLKAAIRLKICQAGGTIADRRVARRDRATYAVARRLRWGSAVDQSGNQGLTGSDGVASSGSSGTTSSAAGSGQ
jgi:ribosomal protein RSM22 (predicted rRNA methylase)